MTVSSARREALAALSGVLLTLSFPKFGNGAIAWFALAPLLLALPGTSGWRAARLGYVTGAVAGFGLLYWTALVVRQFGGLSLPVASMVMGLLCLAVALFPMLFAWVVSVWLTRFGEAALLLAPFAWVATEVIRAHLLMRFAWCLLGYSQADAPVFTQIAAYTAVYGVSFVVAAPAAALAFAAHQRAPAARWKALIGTLLLVGAVAGFGWHRLGQAVPGRDSIRVGIVQASIRQEEKWDSSRLFMNLDRHIELSRRAARDGATLVVWPESAVAFDWDRYPAVAAELRALTRDLGAFLLFGNDDREGPEEAPRLFVGAKLLAPDGQLLLRYHKVRLVPFGEYVPLQPILTLGGRYAARLVQQVSDFTPGDTALVGRIGAASLGVSICYEAIFPDYVRQFTANGAGMLVNITNDAWYGTTSAPFQHFAMARFRAVENGRYLVRAANTGISAVVDPRGRVLARSELFDRTTLVYDVPQTDGLTFYARYGDVFGWSAVAMSAALLAVSRGKRQAG